MPPDSTQSKLAAKRPALVFHASPILLAVALGLLGPAAIVDDDVRVPSANRRLEVTGRAAAAAPAAAPRRSKAQCGGS